jgi:hypothetical protein
MSSSSVKHPTSTVGHDPDRRERQHQARLDFLRGRPTLLARLPDTVGVPNADQTTALDTAVREMKFYQLYPGRSSHAVRWDIRVLVGELRAGG